MSMTSARSLTDDKKDSEVSDAATWKAVTCSYDMCQARRLVLNWESLLSHQKQTIIPFKLHSYLKLLYIISYVLSDIKNWPKVMFE